MKTNPSQLLQRNNLRIAIIKDGEPGNGGSDSSGEPPAGCLLVHRSKRDPGSTADRCGRWAERREELGSGELRREVSSFSWLPSRSYIKRLR